VFDLTKIKVRAGESLEQALRRFSREVTRSKTLEEAKERMEYVKPSTRKFRRKKEKARRIYFENLNAKK
jgi:small subunit ribosomal protein S21